MRGSAAAFLRALGSVRQVLSPGRWALSRALGLGLLAYGLVLVAPVVSQRAREQVSSGATGRASSWELGVAASGIMLLGVAALVFVLAWLAREAELRPYASIAPVLAAFSACVLIGLRAPLPLPAIDPEQLAVFSLAAAVLCGSLVRDEALATQLSGLFLTLFPAFSVLGVIWAATGQADPARAFGELAPRALAFVGMLLLSSFAVALLAALGRDAADLVRAPEGRAAVASRAQVSSDGAKADARSWQPSWRGIFLAVGALLVAAAGLVVALRSSEHATSAIASTQQQPRRPTVSAGEITLRNAPLQPVVDHPAVRVAASAEAAPPSAEPVEKTSVDVEPTERASSRSAAHATRVERPKSKKQSMSKGRRHRRARRAHRFGRSRHAVQLGWGAVLRELPARSRERGWHVSSSDRAPVRSPQAPSSSREQPPPREHRPARARAARRTRRTASGEDGAKAPPTGDESLDGLMWRAISR